MANNPAGSHEQNYDDWCKLTIPPYYEQLEREASRPITIYGDDLDELIPDYRPRAGWANRDYQGTWCYYPGCGTVIDSLRTLLSHLNVVHYHPETWKYACWECLGGAKTERELKNHMRTAHDARTSKDMLDTDKERRRQRAQLVIVKELVDPFRLCPMCGHKSNLQRVDKRKTQMENHMNHYHYGVREWEYGCCQCFLAGTDKLQRLGTHCREVSHCRDVSHRGLYPSVIIKDKPEFWLEAFARLKVLSDIGDDFHEPGAIYEQNKKDNDDRYQQAVKDLGEKQAKSRPQSASKSTSRSRGRSPTREGSHEPHKTNGGALTKQQLAFLERLNNHRLPDSREPSPESPPASVTKDDRAAPSTSKRAASSSPSHSRRRRR